MGTVARLLEAVFECVYRLYVQVLSVIKAQEEKREEKNGSCYLCVSFVLLHHVLCVH